MRQSGHWHLAYFTAYTVWCWWSHETFIIHISLFVILYFS